MDLGIANRVAIVTGGSRGIGRAVAERLCREGASVAVCARSRESLEETQHALEALKGGRVLTVEADLTEPAAAGRVVDATAAAWGRIDILVNNAGAARGIPFDELTQELWLENLQLKLFGYLRLARLVLPHLRRNGWGRIVNVAGLAGLQPSTLSMPIGLNNAGILNVMKALADGEAAHNILVTSVCPGSILTERQTRLLQDVASAKGISLEAAQREATTAIPLRRMGRPEEVADIVAFLASERASYITGSLVIVDGGLHRAMI
ncbi:MAG TPA: SDR family oxidoreductase [Candidatus Methylomirabilis sp.]|nr:SDR family oxidoreductase [Candidatus Methylomirabilis sp.]